MADALLIKTLVVIVASVCAISLVARIRLPAAAGYLLAGLVIGPHGLQLIATSDEIFGRARHHFSHVHGGS
jgi:CPA2 family monovalent cation:H+ antiporter-2